MFGWIPLLLLASCDEVASAITLTIMPIVVSIPVVTAVIYMASRRISQRADRYLPEFI
jgi:hypothetical protein